MINQVHFDIYQATLEKQQGDPAVVIPMPVPDTETNAMGYLQRLVSPLKWKVIECKHSGEKIVPNSNDFDYERVNVKNGRN
ncbi:hypothetical protein [Bacillus subtilis]|uniref:hypothetical protein n=1 Tax=Bacillus subtilis TaxID=1423 RepID=UPI002DBDA879|nr:hypothetical protein [Bacillus subtilis]MEC0285536.1 hypothetical protein [Bacillus subtilis]MEC0481499.1 hypothetical protein [Bacillus subtilis]MEC0522217.1 hypothetical protein [Bacillus subtilis]